MLVLLPPSEGKATAVRGRPVALDALSLPGLTGARAAVLDELVALCEGDQDKAADVLGLTPGLRGEVARNAGLRTAPALPAGRLYTGVLYDALGLGTLDAAAKRRAGQSLLVFSGLWGAVRPADRIPAYRCSMTVRLPGAGGLAAYWKPHLERVLPELAGGGLVLDLRSSAYAAAWRPRGELAARTASVRVLQVSVVDGVERRQIVSHFNKATKGRLVRALLTAGAKPRTPHALAADLRDLGFTVEEDGPRLDVLVREL
ncbi:peroxide stress protein YaaA [Actinacidiphila epipremni]|uniref:Peroxide stress protein YaaA n=1 Tax=Actinacidiphila epipremni TaxID=2053013 RepID=A0ABX0ZLM2_9ACTN|nr:peroxide stress protein YaaA [Actinacidiphila epipremni]NJP44765.1 peroxide stress protein YaaA [Actinacidiphila epipremni]